MITLSSITAFKSQLIFKYKTTTLYESVKQELTLLKSQICSSSIFVNKILTVVKKKLSIET